MLNLVDEDGETQEREDAASEELEHSGSGHYSDYGPPAPTDAQFRTFFNQAYDPDEEEDADPSFFATLVGINGRC